MSEGTVSTGAPAIVSCGKGSCATTTWAAAGALSGSSERRLKRSEMVRRKTSSLSAGSIEAGRVTVEAVGGRAARVLRIRA